tara:strand:+ start:1817 stop:2395 length:579 start_codon:yes stop_codon:yes gene_type:complete
MKPDLNRPFNAQACLDEGGVALTFSPAVTSGMIISPDTQSTLRVVGYSANSVASYEMCSDGEEHLFQFRPDGHSLIEYKKGRVVYHPLSKEEEAQLPPLPPKGYELDRIVTGDKAWGLRCTGMMSAFSGKTWGEPGITKCVALVDKYAIYKEKTVIVSELQYRHLVKAQEKLHSIQETYRAGAAEVEKLLSQ